MSETPLTTREITGEVFIVIGTGESAKLARVDIAAFDANELGASFLETNEALKAERAEGLKLRDQAERLADELEAREKQVFEKYVNLEYKTPEATRESVEAAYFALLKNEPVARAIVSDAAAWLQSLNSPQPYFERLSTQKALATVKTDADGKFKIRVPRGRNIALVATAERLFGADAEIYFWALKVPSDAGTITLSGDNTASSVSKESLLRVGRASSRSIYAGQEVNATTITAALAALSDKPSVPKVIVPAEIPVRPPSPQVRPPPADIFITLRRSVEVARGAGKVIIPAGTKLRLISRGTNVVQVRFENSSEIIPLSATDLAR